MPTILARVRGLVSPIFADEPMRLGDSASGGVGIATTSTAGLVRPDGTSISVDGSGIIAVIGGGGGGGGNVNGDTHPSSPTAWDDEFESGIVLDTTGARFGGANAWTFDTPGSASVPALTNGALVSTGAGTNASYAFQAVPSGSGWEFACKSAVPLNAGSGMPLAFWNSSTGKMVLYYGAISNFLNVGHQTVSPSTFLSSGFTSIATASPASLAIYAGIYQKLSYDGTNIHAWISGTGVAGTFYNWYSETVASFIGSITHVGFQIQPVTSGIEPAVDWFRRTA